MFWNTSGRENGSETSPKLPPGKYKVVGFDLDLTGRNLDAETCQIAAYTPDTQFSQYVMPFTDLDSDSTYRHCLFVATVGKFRMLKSTKTKEVLKTKSEISAMLDFLQWLENLKEESIILVTHDSKKNVQYFLLKALQKYKLLERFSAVVKGFANSLVFTGRTYDKTIDTSYFLKLTEELIGRIGQLHSAAFRARLSYQIVQLLCVGKDERGSGDATSTPEADTPAMSEALRQIAIPIEEEEKELEKLTEFTQRFNTFCPIVGRKWDRFRREALKELLAGANLTYEDLSEAWKVEKKKSLSALLKERITNPKKPEDIEDVTEMIVNHFEHENVSKIPYRRGARSEKLRPGRGGETGEEAKSERSKSGAEKGNKGTTKSSPEKDKTNVPSVDKPAAEKIDASH